MGEEDVNIYKEIEVQPFLDFRVLEEVMVLIVPESSGITDDDHRHHEHHRHDEHDGYLWTSTTTSTTE